MTDVRKDYDETKLTYLPMWRRKCVICKTSNKICPLYPFPDDERFYQWCELVGVVRKDVRRMFLCASHFTTEDFYRKTKQGKLTLGPLAIPSLKLPHGKTKTKEQDDIQRYLSGTALKLDDALKEIELYRIHKQETYKDVLLHFYLTNSYAYKLLEKPLNLIQREKFKLDLLHNPDPVKYFVPTKLAAMVSNQKVCFVSYRCVALTPNIYYDHKLDRLRGLISSTGKVAVTAHFLTISGVYEDWNVLADLIYTNDNTNFPRDWIAQVISNTIVNKMQLKEIVVILLPKFIVTSDLIQFSLPDPFWCSIDTIILYDIQCLLRIMFYNLKTVYYLLKGPLNSERVDLKHLLLLVEKDRLQKYPLLPNLTTFVQLLEPCTFEELQFETILEVFNENTAQALGQYIELNIMPNAAIGMLTFIKKISLFIDILKGNITNHKQIIYMLNDIKTFFNNIIIYTIENNVKIVSETVFNYLNITIKNLSNIVVDNPNLFKAISKNIFFNFNNKLQSEICKKCVSDNPTVKIVSNIVTKHAVINLMKPLKQKKVILDEAIDILIDQLRIFIPKSSFKDIKVNTTEDFDPLDDDINMLDRNDRVTYISGIILKKVALKHNCIAFKKYFTAPPDMIKGNSLIVRSNFRDYIEMLEMVFMNYFPDIMLKDDLLKFMIDKMESIVFFPPCSCFPLYYVKKLFVLIRINYFIKHNNLEFALGRRMRLTLKSL